MKNEMYVILGLSKDATGGARKSHFLPILIATAVHRHDFEVFRRGSISAKLYSRSRRWGIDDSIKADAFAAKISFDFGLLASAVFRNGGATGCPRTSIDIRRGQCLSPGDGERHCTGPTNCVLSMSLLAKRRGKLIAGLRRAGRTRQQLKVAFVRSWSATGGLSRLQSKLRRVAQDPSPRLFELPPLVIRGADGRSILSTGRSLVVEASSRLLREVPEAHILPPGSVILSRGRRFVTENVFGDEEAALRHGALSTFVRSFSPVESQLGVVFSLLGAYSHNYFHWLNHYLPRVEDFLHWRAVAAPNAKLLLAPGAWQIRYLELLGVGSDLCVTYSMKHSIAEVAAVASHPGYLGRIELPATPERLTWLRSRILAALKLKGLPGTRRLFISRRDSIRRPIANDEKISRALEAWGFETVVPSDLEIDDQVRLFAAAGVVVAAHGAGLANLVFSTAPTVIELFPEDWINQAYQTLTLFTGGRHIGLSLQGSSQSGLRADVEGLLRVLAEELGK